MFAKKLSKKDWRVYLKDKINLYLKNQDQEELRLQWEATLKIFFENQKGYWGVFSPLAQEPPIDAFFNSLPLPQNIQVAYPKIQDHEICFYDSQQFELHDWGMQEPLGGRQIKSHEMTGVLVPGLGFNLKGQRLGRGKGFYDRFLQNYEGTKVGVCFETQFVTEELPVDSWDVNMNLIITENGMKVLERD